MRIWFPSQSRNSNSREYANFLHKYNQLYIALFCPVSALLTGQNKAIYNWLRFTSKYQLTFYICSYSCSNFNHGLHHVLVNLFLFFIKPKPSLIILKLMTTDNSLIILNCYTREVPQYGSVDITSGSRMGPRNTDKCFPIF